MRHAIAAHRLGEIAATGHSDIAAKSPPDGYTLLLVAVATYTINANLYPKLPYDARKDLTPVSILAGAPYILTVHPSLPVKSLKELVALAKARPNDLNYGSGGTGTGPQMAMELLKLKTGMRITHIPYKGTGPALTESLAGQVQVGLFNMIAALPVVQSGKLRALAVSGAKRSPALPAVPTLDEANTADLREMARRRLPKGLFEFMDRGNDDEVAMRDNRIALERIKLKPRVLVDVSKRSQEISLFGKKQQMPVIVAPTGSTGLAWYEGEIALARAAAAHGIPFTLAAGSMTALERVAAEAGGTLWFQFYMWPDRALSHQLVARARDAGYEALVFTVDTPVAPGREYNLRNGFTIPFKFTRRNVVDVLTHPRWLFGVLTRYMVTTGMPRYQNFPAHTQTRITALPMGRSTASNDSISWDDVRQLRKLWPGKLIVKGVQHPQDAVMAADCGADAIVLSNHGGRVLDSTTAPILVLPQVVDAVGKRITVIVDSGFRRGGDVVKALALGADAVMLGRAPCTGPRAQANAVRCARSRFFATRSIAYWL